MLRRAIQVDAPRSTWDRDRGNNINLLANYAVQMQSVTRRGQVLVMWFEVRRRDQNTARDFICLISALGELEEDAINIVSLVSRAQPALCHAHKVNVLNRAWSYRHYLTLGQIAASVKKNMNFVVRYYQPTGSPFVGRCQLKLFSAVWDYGWYHVIGDHAETLRVGVILEPNVTFKSNFTQLSPKLTVLDVSGI
ncbi:hypothetical protein PAXRUDRAFT_792662 [Paxillus rubicundulus Ve08.2h10]|uniref:Uncharacterized protein n=1 Tax=Paxillus rubicundulus Ve08.2h10 TaxID=930991 RepID=A0A0D0E4A2_9AGAM|nr:hypothetical protein PAXRUDRAFT_792662 [Paxillus rubicundulus Ve08.2h10]